MIVHACKTGIMFVLDAKPGKYIHKPDIFVPQQNMWVAPIAEGVTTAPAAAVISKSPIPARNGHRPGFDEAMHLPVKFTIEKDLDESGHSEGNTKGLTIGENRDYDLDSLAGYFSAIDLTRGKVSWQNKATLRFVCGVSSTSAGLVFRGETEEQMRTFDSEAGETLWQLKTRAGVDSPPIPFSLDGEEFVAVCAEGACSEGLPKGYAVFIFGIP